jgi:hypothetical protein
MGTIAIYRNVRIMIFPRDHGPPHIHAVAPDAEAVFILKDLELVRSRGFDSGAVTKIRQFLEERKDELLEAWYEIHGEEKN